MLKMLHGPERKFVFTDILVHWGTTFIFNF